jgi:hypothetical protein
MHGPRSSIPVFVGGCSVDSKSREPPGLPKGLQLFELDACAGPCHHDTSVALKSGLGMMFVCAAAVPTLVTTATTQMTHVLMSDLLTG